MEIRFDDELTCRFALEVGWSTATHVSVVSQRSSECQTLLQNRQFISELRKGTKPVIWPWQEKIYICYFTSFQNFSMKSNCLTLGQKSPKSLIATAAILVVRTARGAGATSLELVLQTVVVILRVQKQTLYLFLPHLIVQHIYISILTCSTLWASIFQ